MKQKIMMGACSTLLLCATAWSAPKTAAPKAQPAGMDEIRVFSNYSAGVDHGGDVGSSESWTIRANDTAIHNRSFSVMEAAPDIDGDVGILKPGSFAQMLDYLQWTHLLDPKNSGGGGELSVSLKRSGKVKSASIGGSAANWATSTVVESLVKDVVWRTPAQYKSGTGLSVIYQVDDPLKEAEAAKAFPRPMFSVLNTAGKEVAVLKSNTDKERAAFLSLHPVYTDIFGDNSLKDKDMDSYLTLAPGTYHFAFKKWDGALPAGAPEFEWRVILDDNAKVTPGQFYPVFIRAVKKGTPKI